LISENVAKISCTEYFRNNQKRELGLLNLKGTDCLKAEQNTENIEMILENTENDTVIIPKYQSTANKRIGNIEELKKFWSA